MKILHVDQLTKARACSEQIELFRSTFGESVNVTEALCAKYFDKFYWNWAAGNLLSAQGRAEYERVTGPALAEYERVTGPAWAEYERVRGLAFGRLYVAEGVK